MQVILIMDYLNNNKNKSSFTKLKFLKNIPHLLKIYGNFSSIIEWSMCNIKQLR